MTRPNNNQRFVARQQSGVSDRPPPVLFLPGPRLDLPWQRNLGRVHIDEARVTCVATPSRTVKRRITWVLSIFSPAASIRTPHDQAVPKSG